MTPSETPVGWSYPKLTTSTRLHNAVMSFCLQQLTPPCWRYTLQQRDIVKRRPMSHGSFLSKMTFERNLFRVIWALRITYILASCYVVALGLRKIMAQESFSGLFVYIKCQTQCQTQTDNEAVARPLCLSEAFILRVDEARCFIEI